MFKVIRSTKIEEECFPLVLEVVVPEEVVPETQPEEPEKREIPIEEEEADARFREAEELLARSREVLQASEQEAKQIVAEAKRQGETIFEEAREQGYAEGFAKGLTEGREQGMKEGREEGLALTKVKLEEKLQQIQMEAKDTIDQAENVRAQLLAGAEEEVVELVMTIASKVIHSHVEVKRDTVVRLAAEALERAISAGYYTIFVNPGDVELLREYISELRRSASGGARIHIIADSSISPGGCKVETEHGLVDMTLESQLEQIRRALRDELERNG